MKPRLIARLLLALALPVAGCQSPTETTETNSMSFDTGPAGDGLTVRVGTEYIVLYAVPPAGVEAKVVDYVIVEIKTGAIVLHVENSNAARNFRNELDRSRLPKGIYRMRTYLNKSMTPFDDEEITIP